MRCLPHLLPRVGWHVVDDRVSDLFVDVCIFHFVKFCGALTFVAPGETERNFNSILPVDLICVNVLPVSFTFEMTVPEGRGFLQERGSWHNSESASDESSRYLCENLWVRDRAFSYLAQNFMNYQEEIRKFRISARVTSTLENEYKKKSSPAFADCSHFKRN